MWSLQGSKDGSSRRATSASNCWGISTTLKRPLEAHKSCVRTQDTVCLWPLITRTWAGETKIYAEATPCRRWKHQKAMVMGVIGEEGRMGIYCQKLQMRMWRSYPEGQRTQQQYSRVEDILARWSLLLGIIRYNYNLFPTAFSEERIFPPHNSRKLMVYQATGI